LSTRPPVNSLSQVVLGFTDQTTDGILAQSMQECTNWNLFSGHIKFTDRGFIDKKKHRKIVFDFCILLNLIIAAFLNMISFNVHCTSLTSTTAINREGNFSCAYTSEILHVNDSMSPVNNECFRKT
jgi:hypothetical protein